MPKKGTTGKPSALVDIRVIYCGDRLEQFEKLAQDCIDLIYIDRRLTPTVTLHAVRKGTGESSS